MQKVTDTDRTRERLSEVLRDEDFYGNCRLPSGTKAFGCVFRGRVRAQDVYFRDCMFMDGVQVRHGDIVSCKFQGELFATHCDIRNTGFSHHVTLRNCAVTGGDFSAQDQYLSTGATRFMGTGFAGATFAYATFDYAMFEACDFTNAHLDGTHWENVHYGVRNCWAGSGFDPAWRNTNGLEPAVRTRVHGKYVYGVRTYVSMHHGEQKYDRGEYRAPVFSHESSMSCHPGLYFGGGGYHSERSVIVRARVEDTIRVSLTKGMRTRRFAVLTPPFPNAAAASAALGAKPADYWRRVRIPA